MPQESKKKRPKRACVDGHQPLHILTFKFNGLFHPIEEKTVF